ncbi:MAG: pyruvate kinase alpha/beta domain-containing protein [archaeon]
MPNEIWNTVYFEKTGPENTNDTLRLAKERAERLGIRNIVVASSTGSTGAKASEVFKGYNLIIVTRVTGFKEPNFQEFDQKNSLEAETNGAKIITAAHAFGTLGRAVNRKFQAIQVDEIIAHVLRLFGAGVKVACEISCMATDAGLIRTNEDVIGIGGTGGGADAAIVVRAANTHNFFDMRIREIICKPRM